MLANRPAGRRGVPSPSIQETGHDHAQTRSTIFIVAATRSVLGCASQSEPQSPGAYMGDSWVT
jgi:hypothetical protein